MIKEELYKFAIDFLKDESGIDLGEGREQFLETRLQEVSKKYQFKDVDTFLTALKNNELKSGVRDELINSLTTNESYFFRDLKPFNLLKEVCLPRLIARNKSSKKLRIWSAAASNGQEAYSIAMTILESFPELESWDFEILATDIDQAVLDYAREGVYSSFEVNRGIEEKLRDKYFTQEGGSWRVKDRIKKMVNFTKYNLMDPVPFNDTFDMVFLRNVIIYFDKDTKKKVLEKFSQKMHSESYLLLGGAESTQWITNTFQRETECDTSYYRLSQPQNILIVDDEPDIVDVIKELLVENYQNNIHVDVAYDGQEGLEKCLSKEYALVITDQFMPKLTGTEMIRKIFEHDKGLKRLHFLVVSGYVEDFKSNAPEIDHIFFIDKPFTAERILRKTNLLLNKTKLCA